MKIVIRPSSRSDNEAYREALEEFEQFRLDTLNVVGTLHSGNIERVAQRVREKEVLLTEAMCRAFKNVPETPLNPVFPMCQSGDTCVPMSVSNSLLVLGQEEYFGAEHEDRIAATNHIIDHFLATEPGHDRGERRSLDRVAHYFKTNAQTQIGIEQTYHFELTGSLIKMAYALYSRKGTVLSVFRAHCQIAYALFRDNGVTLIEMKDPLLSQNKALDTDQFAEHFAWSALGGLPNAVANGATFDLHSAAKLLNDQAERNNTGVLCTSGILWRTDPS